MTRIDVERIREYANRDWDLVASVKASHWQPGTLTPSERLAIADALREHVARLRPDWPSAEDRAADVAVHARVAAWLRSVDPSRRR